MEPNLVSTIMDLAKRGYTLEIDDQGGKLRVGVSPDPQIHGRKNGAGMQVEYYDLEGEDDLVSVINTCENACKELRP